MKGNVAAIVLVLVGTYLLLGNLGLINVSLIEIFSIWWPALLIGLGLMLFFLFWVYCTPQDVPYHAPKSLTPTYDKTGDSS